MILRIYRWSPEAPAERFDSYPVAAAEGTTVLDALVRLREGAAPDLAFRYACRVGMCGSCAVVVDGRERWACRTRLRAVARPDATVTLRPLYHFPLIRDLVVDMAPFAEKMKQVGAAFLPREPEARAPAAIPADSLERRTIDPTIECIGCGACVSACTMVGWDSRFPGPAALNRALTLVADRRDAGGTAARWAALFDEDGVWRCHGQAQCTAVCPMTLSPADSILRLRRRATRSLFLRT
ncbi:MAG TPA: succinate dehydrogenase/fumarate reductase iron-sulfur subunit [Methylomirabilota bacterium]|jgi:fumarate reductase iron-sulfur subunit|nr:succinate dehydrogenase/fumarate reductase iron-sulfur subunit [Methylomirabilota bacterium]